MLPGQGRPLTLEAGQSAEYSTLMLFDCRGYDPVDFVFTGGWKAVSVSFHIFLSLAKGYKCSDYQLYLFDSNLIGMAMYFCYF